MGHTLIPKPTAELPISYVASPRPLSSQKSPRDWSPKQGSTADTPTGVLAFMPFTRGSCAFLGRIGDMWTLLGPQGSWCLGSSRGPNNITLFPPQLQRVKVSLGQNSLISQLKV